MTYQTRDAQHSSCTRRVFVAGLLCTPQWDIRGLRRGAARRKITTGYKPTQGSTGERQWVGRGEGRWRYSLERNVRLHAIVVNVIGNARLK